MVVELRLVADATPDRRLASAPFFRLPVFVRDESISVVVRDLDPRRAFRRPGVTDPVLVVDSDRILPVSIAAQLLPSVARWKPEGIARCRCVRLVELATSDAPELTRARMPRSSRVSAVEHICRAAVPKGADHGDSVASPQPIGL